jgi:peptide/nickel transport system ATP-binding protein
MIPPDPAPMLRIADLRVCYPTEGGTITALNGVSLQLAKGRTLGIVGESGSGKSTIALAAMGLLPKQARIEAEAFAFFGQDLRSASNDVWRKLRGARIAMVFQDPFSVLNPSLRIGEQIGEGLIYHLNVTPDEARARSIALLDEVGIANPAATAAAYPHELSGGMRQRALIAGALAAEPELLVLDEPTTALDVTIEAQILDLLQNIQAKRGLAMMLISHNLGVVRRIADEVAVIYAGELLEQGPTAEIFSHPRHP